MKIDCGKTENYLKCRKEICDKHPTCVGCPLFHNEDGTNDTCYNISDRDPKKAIDELQKWVDENIHDDDEKKDPVNQPAHYTAGRIECIEAIKASMTDEEFRVFLKGQVIKYIWQYQLKDSPARLEKGEILP